MQGVKIEDQGRAQQQRHQQLNWRYQQPALAAAVPAAAEDDSDVVLTGVSTVAERGRLARANAIELLDGVPSSHPLSPQKRSPAGQRPQLFALPPSCELLDSASPEAVLRALALADKLGDSGLVLLCEAILAARISEVSRCSAFVTLASQSPAKAARTMARVAAVALTTSSTMN